jgi:putative flippase GtrA
VQRLDQIDPETHRVAKFAVVGIGSTAVTLGAYAVLLALGVPYFLAAPMAWTLGLLNGYTWNRLWTFERASHRYALMGRYFAVGGIGLTLNTALLALLIEALSVGRLPAEVIALPVVVVVTFLLNRYWVFRSHLRDAEQMPPARSG